MGYGWPYEQQADGDALEARDDRLDDDEREWMERDRLDEYAPAGAPVPDGPVDVADSPQVARLREAVAELNAAEGALVLELPDAVPEHALKLAQRVGAAREEFGAAFDEMVDAKTCAWEMVPVAERQGGNDPF